MRAAMIDAMKFWVSNCDIDGFRCDVAGEVPVDFWNQARVELEKVKPMFMLAEEEGTKGMCEKAFDANYGWGMHHAMHKVAKGEDSANFIVKHLMKVDSTLPKHAMQMNFITNHDENSWNGTASEKFGAGENTFAVLTYTLPGIPLIYNGQEAGLNHRLKFFVKDSINWNLADFSPFYKTLNALKHTNEALWNPPFGGNFEKLNNSLPGSVLTFTRNRDNKTVLVIANLSGKDVKFTMNAKSAAGNFTEVFDKTKLIFKGDETFTLPAWGYKVFEK
jgi:glycosidase